MRSTSPTKLTLDYASSESEVNVPLSNTHPNPTSTETLNVPTFVAYGEVYAAASRRAGRMNAASISDTEHQALLLERQLLLDKKFAGGISRTDSNRLAYVRWSLDRIEDAKHGATLDVLEHSISSYEQFSKDIAALQSQIQDIQSPSRK